MTDERMPRVERGPNDEIRFFHTCRPPFDELEREEGRWLAGGPGGWVWGEGDSLTPSIHCHGCGLHGWWNGSERGWKTI